MDKINLKKTNTPEIPNSSNELNLYVDNNNDLNLINFAGKTKNIIDSEKLKDLNSNIINIKDELNKKINELYTNLLNSVFNEKINIQNQNINNFDEFNNKLNIIENKLDKNNNKEFDENTILLLKDQINLINKINNSLKEINLFNDDLQLIINNLNNENNKQNVSIASISNYANNLNDKILNLDLSISSEINNLKTEIVLKTKNLNDDISKLDSFLRNKFNTDINGIKNSINDKINKDKSELLTLVKNNIIEIEKINNKKEIEIEVGKIEIGNKADLKIEKINNKFIIDIVFPKEKISKSGGNGISLYGVDQVLKNYVNKNGDTLLGKLIFAASTTANASFNIPCGVKPSSPNEGDVWMEEGNRVYIKNCDENIIAIDNITNSVGCVEKPTILVSADGTNISASNIHAYIYSQPSWKGDYVYTEVPSSVLNLTNNSINYLIVNYNSGNPRYEITTSPNDINGSSKILSTTLYRENTDVHYISVDWGLSTANRQNDKDINLVRYERSSGLILSVSGSNMNLTSGVIWYGVTANSKPAITSSPSATYLYYHTSSSTWSKNILNGWTEDFYDDGSSLQTLNNNHYTINWIYRFVDGDNLPNFAIVLGNSYNNLADVKQETIPTIPTIISRMCILVGRIIVKKGTGVIEVNSAFTDIFSGSVITEHNNLAGLQGGNATSGEYYHLSYSQYNNLIDSSVVNSLTGQLTLLTTTSEISSNLQNQINSISIVGGPGITASKNDLIWTIGVTGSFGGSDPSLRNELNGITGSLQNQIIGLSQSLSGYSTLSQTYNASANAYQQSFTQSALMSANSFAQSKTISYSTSANAYQQAYTLVNNTSAALLYIDSLQDVAMSGALTTITFNASANAYNQSFTQSALMSANSFAQSKTISYSSSANAYNQSFTQSALMSANSFVQSKTISYSSSANAYQQSYTLVNNTSAALLSIDSLQDAAMSGACNTITYNASANAYQQSINYFRNATNEPNGFENRTDSSINWNNATRTFTINGNYNIWIKGIKYSKTGETQQIPNTIGNHYFYYDESGNFVYSMNAWDILTTAQIAYVYWDGKIGILYEERHGLIMDRQTHYYLHTTRGAQYSSGLTLGNYTLNTSTSAALNYSLSSGLIEDEDIAFTTTVLNSGGPYTILTKIGSNGTWDISAGNILPFINENNICYNQYTGSTWQMTPASIANKYINYYICASTAISSQYQIIIIPGQTEYNTLALAQAENFANLSLGVLPINEMISIYKIIYYSSNSNGGPGKASIIEVDRIINNNVNIISNTQNSFHNSLSGLQGGSSTSGEYFHLDASQYNNFIGRSEIASITANLIAYDNLQDAALSGSLFLSPTKIINSNLVLDSTNWRTYNKTRITASTTPVIISTNTGIPDGFETEIIQNDGYTITISAGSMNNYIAYGLTKTNGEGAIVSMRVMNNGSTTSAYTDGNLT